MQSSQARFDLKYFIKTGQNIKQMKQIKNVNKSTIASAAILFAGVLWGCISLPVRKLSAEGFAPIQVTFVRLFCAALLLTVYTAVFHRKKLIVKFRDLPLFAGTGIISIVLFNCCYFYAMIKGEASVAVVLLYTSPMFVMLISRFVFRERFTWRKIGALLLTIVGCVCVSGFIGNGHRVTPTVFVIGIGSGLFYGLYTIFGKLALRKYDSQTVTVYTFIFGVLGSFPLSGIGEMAKSISRKPSIIITGMIIGIFCTLLPYLLYTFGLKYAQAGKAAVLATAEPLVGAVIGITVLGEAVNRVKIAGILLILTAIIILSKEPKE